MTTFKVKSVCFTPSVFLPFFIPISIVKDDYISLSDIANGFEGGTGLIEKWIRNKNTIEYLAVWETLYNPTFNSPEFEGIKSEAGTNRFMMSVKHGMTSKDWKLHNPDLTLKDRNIRDYADLHQLTVLSNLESYNAILISQNVPQNERLIELNRIAISQLNTLRSMTNYSLDKLKSPNLKILEKLDED